MSFQTEKLSSHMAAAVSGLDLNRLPDAETRAALLDVLHGNLVLCIRAQTLAPPAFRDAMAQFGAPMLRNRMERIVGLEREESDRLLDELITHAIQPKYQYRHVWRQGDIVIWDNRCTMHKANADYPDGERRLMHRVIVAGTAPV